MGDASSPSRNFVSEVEKELMVDLETNCEVEKELRGPAESEHGRRDDAEADATPVDTQFYAHTDSATPAAAAPATANVDPASDVPAREFATAAVAHAAAEPATTIDSAQPRSSSEASSVSLRKPKAVSMTQLDISAALQESLEVADDRPECYKCCYPVSDILKANLYGKQSKENAQ